MTKFLDLSPVRHAQRQLRRQQFIHRHITRSKVGLICFALGCVFTTLVFIACAVLTPK